MTPLWLKFVLLINNSIIFGVVIHTKGPTHKKLAVSCLEEIAREHFHFQYGKSDENHTMLLTAMVSNGMASPAFEIQEGILKKVHQLAKWYQIEVLTYGERYEFQSYAECLEDDCQKSFIIDFKSNFYVIVVESEDNFDIILEVVQESNTFNPKAMFLVYYEYFGSDYKKLAKLFLMKMRNRLLTRTAVLIPKTVQIFSFYKLNTATKGPYECGSNVTLDEIDQCVKGRMLNIKKRYYELSESKTFLNCSVGVIAMPHEPFVINQTQGFEIEVLQSISSIIKVNFNVTISENHTGTWGSEERNGSWTGKLKLVYENYYLGVGNVETGMDYAVDFSFSRFYHMEPLVFVVPIAKFVPKWRVLVAIFTVEMWGICVGIIISFAISFHLASKLGERASNFKSIGSCFYQSYQIIICHSVPHFPTSDITRVLFVSLSILGIILCSAYTCSLIYYLKNPIREHQAAEIADIMDNFGEYKYGVGGISRLRELFVSSEDEGFNLFKIYQTASGENDTLLYWINKVAEDRNIWTISSKLFVNYLLAQNYNITTDILGKPKIYVFKKQLISYSISVIMRKGHPLLENIDYAIQKLTWAGLVAHMSDKYTEAIKRKNSASDDDDDSYKPLSLEHLQGAFALLTLGYIGGCLSLIMECFIKNVNKGKTRKVKKVGKKRGHQHYQDTIF